MVTPTETIVEINDVSDDYNGQLLLYRDIPATAAFEKPTAVKLEGDDLERMGAYFDLISRVLKKNGVVPCDRPALGDGAPQ
jgi:hypothetical protein